MRYHYGSPYEGEPDSPYEVKPDSPEATEDPDSPEATEDPDSPEPAQQANPPAGARWSRWRLLLAGGGLLVIVAVVLGFLAHAGSTGSNTTRQAAATATPVPRVVYSADWSHGAAGWTLPAHWSLVHGHIENDGNGTAPLLIPYEVTQQNYTVNVDFTVQSIPAYKACHSYGIEGLSSGNTLQFLGGVVCITKLTVAYHAFSETFVPHADSPADGLSTNDYTVVFYTQTFSAQVQEGHNVDFCPGVSCLANRNSTTPLSPLHIAIDDVGVRLTVSRIVITTP